MATDATSQRIISRSRANDATEEEIRTIWELSLWLSHQRLPPTWLGPSLIASFLKQRRLRPTRLSFQEYQILEEMHRQEAEDEGLR